MDELILIKLKKPKGDDIEYVRDLFKRKKIFHKDLRPNMSFIDGMGREKEEIEEIKIKDMVIKWNKAIEK